MNGHAKNTVPNYTAEKNDRIISNEKKATPAEVPAPPCPPYCMAGRFIWHEVGWAATKASTFWSVRQP